MEMVEQIFSTVVQIAQLFLEVAGLIILVMGGVKCFIGYLKGEKYVRLELAVQISLALEFLMAGEILHTIVAEDLNELIILGAIIVFRAILTWENGHELKEMREREELSKTYKELEDDE